MTQYFSNIEIKYNFLKKTISNKISKILRFILIDYKNIFAKIEILLVLNINLL